MAHPELGEAVLNRFAESLSEVSVVDAPVKQEGRNIAIILAPKK
jgi:translation initiation factor IF-3